MKIVTVRSPGSARCAAAGCSHPRMRNSAYCAVCRVHAGETPDFSPTFRAWLDGLIEKAERSR